MIKRIQRTTKVTPEEAARVKAIRDKHQREKPSMEQVLAEDPDAFETTMGELMQLRQIAHLLKNARLEQSLTLAEISERTGIDQGALSRFENGSSINPTLSTISRIATALGKSVQVTLSDN